MAAINELPQCSISSRMAKRGERAVRTTSGAAKKLTYAKLVRIVDGSDGRTYLAMLTLYGSISIIKG